MLAALLEQREAAQAGADEARERLESLTAAVKAEIYGRAPGATRFSVTGSAHWPGMSMKWLAGGRRLDSRRMKDQDPALYDAWSVPVTPHWELRRT